MIDTIQAANGCKIGHAFYFPIRVYFEDTDTGGIVYYANYLKFAERARTEFLRYNGINQQQIFIENQTGFVVRSCNIEYLSSAFLDDCLTVSCEISELTAASAVIKQEIYREKTLLASLKVKVIFMNINKHKPTKIPPEFVAKFSAFLS